MISGQLECKRAVYSTRSEAEKSETRLKTKTQNLHPGVFQPEDKKPENISLENLSAAYAGGIKDYREQTRAKRIFEYFLDNCVSANDFPVTDLRMPHLKNHITARKKDEVKSANIYRELNAIASARHSAAEHFPELDGWSCPKISRKGRERITEKENI